MKIRTTLHIKSIAFLLPFFLYEELWLSVLMLIAGIILIYSENVKSAITRLDWREYLFFIYMFHMLFGERSFAYVGIEPLFVTEIVLVILTAAYAKDLLKIRRVLAIYYIIVMIGFAYAFVYFFQFRLDAVRDSFMLIYAFWVPLVYHVFRDRKHYHFFFLLLKLFIVLKAIAYSYEGLMIVTGLRSLTFEGFRFGVGYVVPSLIVISLFLPLKHLGWKYKLLSLLMIPAVFTIFHRSIFLGIFLALTVIFYMGSNGVKKNILRYGLSTLFLLIGFLILYDSLVEVDLFRILERKSSLEEGNINYRVLSWEHVMEKFYANFLLGYGVGRPIMFAYQNVFYSTVELTYFQIRDLAGNAQPHNSYLNILARFGILIFPFFLYAIFKPLFRIRQYVARATQNGTNEYSMLLLLTGLLMLMYVFTFFNVVLEGPHHSFAFWLVIGMLLGMGRSGLLNHKTIRIKRTVVIEE
ncbi:MAG: O-antigen ligase domain-containing protein [Balneolaceae bacterium]|nr:MAG: O-antigen ligase domain-containing protein [Balneolaceae bacterium]